MMLFSCGFNVAMALMASHNGDPSWAAFFAALAIGSAVVAALERLAADPAKETEGAE